MPQQCSDIKSGEQYGGIGKEDEKTCRSITMRKHTCGMRSRFLSAFLLLNWFIEGIRYHVFGDAVRVFTSN